MLRGSPPRAASLGGTGGQSAVCREIVPPTEAGFQEGAARLPQRQQEGTRSPPRC